MTKSRVFVSRRLPGDAVERLRERAEVDLWEGDLSPDRATLLARSRDAEGLVCLLTEQIDAELLDACPRLRAVCNVAVGYDNIDVVAATRAGVFATNTPGVLTDTTADFAFALLMAAARRIPEGDRFTRAGHWQTWDPSLLLGTDIHGATLGLIGVGQIDLGLERRDLEPLLREADFVSLHVPLLPETHHLIGERQLALMKRSAVLINTSRGPVVDGAALFRALQQGTPAAAALDVTEVEPIEMTDPLLTLENVIVTPHIASGSLVTRSRMAAMAVENVLAGMAGKTPPNCLNPEASVRLRARGD